MEISKLKENLLNLLEDIEVKEKILHISRISYTEENKDDTLHKSYEQELEEKKLLIKNLSHELEINKVEINKKNYEIKNIKEELKSRKNELVLIKQENIEKVKIINELNDKIYTNQEEYNAINEKYYNLEYIFNIFNSLSINTKQELSGIFKKNNIENFVFCGSQYDNIDMLWDYIKNKIIENNYEDIKSLKIIFNYFFEGYNQIYDNAIYNRLNTLTGKDYDNDMHIRISEGKVSGQISEVLLDGYKNNNTGRIEKKSVIRI